MSHPVGNAFKETLSVAKPFCREAYTLSCTCAGQAHHIFLNFENQELKNTAS